MATSSSRGRSAASDALQPRSRELESVGTAPDGIYETLIECVKAIGGSKVAGIALWPAKGVEASQRHLLACLNPERNEKLGPDEVLHVLRLAREREGLGDQCVWLKPAEAEFECLGEPSLCTNPRGCGCAPDSKTPNGSNEREPTA